jgi:hypothetical protein
MSLATLQTTFHQTQRWIKGAIATALGITNFAGIWFSIHLTQTAFFQTLLSGFSAWLIAPLSLNLFSFFQGILNLLIILIHLTTQLLLWLLTLGHPPTSLIQWINWITATLFNALNSIDLSWLTITTIPPSKLIPFSQALLNLIASSDEIAAIILATLITLICTSLTIWIFSLDIPRYIARKINERRARKAFRQLRALETTLQSISFYELPLDETESLRLLATLLYQAKQGTLQNQLTRYE